VPGQITANPPFEVPDGLPTWYSIKIPPFSSGATTIVDYAVEPLAANRLWVTNGTVVLRSEDSGCHWGEVYAISDTGSETGAGSRILEIEPGGSGHIYLAIQETGPVPRPHVVVTSDAGDTWSQADGPALAGVVGRLRDLDASLGNGAAAAMLVDVELSEPGVASLQGQQAVLTTATAGTTWDISPLTEGDLSASVATVGASSSGGRSMSMLAMNPVRPSEIWLYGENGAARFTPQGLEDAGIGPVSVLDIALDGRAIVAYAGGETGRVSLDGGGSWSLLRTGFPVDSMDIISSIPLQIATGSYGRVLGQYLYPGQTAPLLQNLSPLDGRPVSDLQVGFPESGTRPSIYGRSLNTIEVLYQPTGKPIDRSQMKIPLVAPPPLTGKNGLAPARKDLRMRPGDSATIPYTLSLPAASTPLDVYFMIDVSSSMQNTINGIKGAMQQIANKLSQSGIPTQFGVGSFSSYDTPPAYEQNRDIGPVGAELAQALNGLRATGGGEETQMAALLQSVTGEGDAVIPPDLNMHFRPGSLRVAIEVTDEPISQGGPHPSYATVTDALLAHGVRQVGLAIMEPPLLGDDDYKNPGGPAQGLQVVAEGSKAVAPEGGVDCDGDGDIELDPNDPLVCIIHPDRADDASLMTDAIVNVVKAIEDIQDLSITAGPGADPYAMSPIVESITPTILPARDLKEPTYGNFEVTVRCPHVVRPTLFPVDVRVSRPGSAIASADLNVNCVPIVKKAEVLPLLAAIIPVAAVPPPPPRPPDPVPEPNPNPQPNPQGNPQTGFAAQEQQQPQVALAGQEGAGVEPDVAAESAPDEFFMSDNSESRVPPVGFIFTAAAITSLGGYLLVTNQRTRTAHARNRRDRRR
jgi:hypothetical protein